MANEIRVPTLGESVTEATIGKWFKKPGDAVAVDEPLVELETDKVTIEVPAPAALPETAEATPDATDAETAAIEPAALPAADGDGVSVTTAAMNMPAAAIQRGPKRGNRIAVASVDITITMLIIGRNASPVVMGVKPRFCCR